MLHGTIDSSASSTIYTLSTYISDTFSAKTLVNSLAIFIALTGFSSLTVILNISVSLISVTVIFFTRVSSLSFNCKLFIVGLNTDLLLASWLYVPIKLFAKPTSDEVSVFVFVSSFSTAFTNTSVVYDWYLGVTK